MQNLPRLCRNEFIAILVNYEAALRASVPLRSDSGSCLARASRHVPAILGSSESQPQSHPVMELFDPVLLNGSPQERG